MKHVYLFVIFIVLSLVARAQQDSVPAPKPMLLEQKINASRLELRSAFLNEDPVGVGLWLDSLARLEDDTYIGVNWDERWLLYYWTENYGTLLAEASQFGTNERSIQAWKVPPPADSVFELIDYTMYERRFDIFQNIRHAFLNEEEKAFSTLLLEYLLRMNKDEEDWAARIQAFRGQYPSSRFNYFLNSVKPAILKPANKGLGLSLHFLSGSWSKGLERSFKPLYGAQLDFYYWVARWNVTASMVFGGPRLARDIIDPGVNEIWPKDDPTSFFSFGLEFGYDIINNSKVRIFPAVVGAITSFKPPAPEEDEDPPSYYDPFTFLEGHIGVCVTADAKLFGKNTNDWGVPKGSYHGIRLKVGYNWQNFKRQNPFMDGNLFYFAVGYNLFAFLEAKK